jgi:uncharacterized membrane protein YhaH (DUF805 family)
VENRQHLPLGSVAALKGFAKYYLTTGGKMTNKGYLIVSGCFFFFVAVLHFLRLIFQAQVQVGGWVVPLWMSVGGVIVPLLFCFFAVRLLKSSKI